MVKAGKADLVPGNAAEGPADAEPEDATDQALCGYQTDYLAQRSAKGNSVNYEHLDPDAALRPDRVPDERVLAERQQHQLCASVIPSSAPVIWTLLASPVCGRSCDDPCRVPCRGVT